MRFAQSVQTPLRQLADRQTRTLFNRFTTTIFFTLFLRRKEGAIPKLSPKSNIMYISRIFNNTYSLELFMPDTIIFESKF